MVDYLETSPQPSPMLEQELSQDTLDAIKAIVSDGNDTVSADDVCEAITDAIAPSENKMDHADEPNSDTDLETEVQCDQEPAATILDIVESETVVEELVEPIVEQPGVEIALIRETVALAELDEEAECLPQAPEEAIIRPPGFALRLKRHLRNKLRMHFLIAKMKLRDLLPTKKEFLRSLTPRRLAIAVLIATAFLKPWFYPTALILLLFIGSFALLVMGPDRVKHYADLAWRRYKRLNPEKALQLRGKTMALFEKWQKRLDRLPTRWTQGLHLPQFQSEAEKSAAESAYAVRMARIAQDELPKSYS